MEEREPTLSKNREKEMQKIIKTKNSSQTICLSKSMQEGWIVHLLRRRGTSHIMVSTTKGNQGKSELCLNALNNLLENY